MLEVLPASDPVVALRVTGRVDEDDVERGIHAIDAALARQERIALYAELEVAGMSPGAFARDLRYGLGKLHELRRFPRVAVVTSQDWVRWVAQVENAVFPQMEIRVFSSAQQAEALAWVSQPLPPLDTEVAAAGPSIQFIETTNPSVIAVEVNGRIRSEDMRRLIAVSDEAMSKHARVRVLARIVNFDGLSLEALGEPGLVAMKMRAWRQIDRYALVGGPSWMAAVTSWSAPLVRIQTRHFQPGRESDAWQWLEAEPREMKEQRT